MPVGLSKRRVSPRARTLRPSTADVACTSPATASSDPRSAAAVVCRRSERAPIQESPPALQCRPRAGRRPHRTARVARPAGRRHCRGHRAGERPFRRVQLHPVRRRARPLVPDESMPLCVQLFTKARITAFNPGASPPPVRMHTRLNTGTAVAGTSRAVPRDLARLRGVVRVLLRPAIPVPFELPRALVDGNPCGHSRVE